ncbi:hypothetical protein PPACK8108_LOCUS10623 [Phakopsora pachyrhizi]|uniref:NUDE domain-containing protein n=1 Tax=Phakopsora pachyrhizi TaxID=170000 RepID=A0AAV0B0H3_PHAPC|nr:hypothetical protein PPACK8108_LOCUS10623 [Phakopsora pachyrhizi]
MEEPSFKSDQDALDHYRTLARNLQYDLDDTRLALDEFQQSSKELENELENELQATEKQLKDLKIKEENLIHEMDQWKNKYHSSLRDHTKTMTHMQTELESLRTSNEEYRTRLRDMELDNDELEGKERMVTSSLQDVESKYGKAIERITLLEDELIEKSRLEEECQRLKDDLRDMTEEIAVLRVQQRANSTSSTISTSASNPTSQILTPLEAQNTSPETSLSESGMEVLKDPKDLNSPLRVMARSKQLINSENSPRRRLISYGAISSPSRENSITNKSVAWTSRKASTLRVKSPLGTARPGLREVLSPGSKIPTPGIQNVASSSTSSTSNMTRSLQATTTTSATPPINGRRSHLQSLRAETERLQGMTKKLVSSRTLRQVSSIPVPKALGLSQSTSINRSHALNNSTNLSRLSGVGSSESQRAAASSRALNSQTTNQDRAGGSNETFQTNSTPTATAEQTCRSNSRNSVTTRVPRPKNSLNLSTSNGGRLSIGSEQQHQLGGAGNGFSKALMERSTTPILMNKIPMRKVSLECTERFLRPMSVQENYRSHFRRKSTGIGVTFGGSNLSSKNSLRTELTGENLSGKVTGIQSLTGQQLKTKRGLGTSVGSGNVNPKLN